MDETFVSREPLILRLTATVSSSYFAHNAVPPDQVPAVIRSVTARLRTLIAATRDAAEAPPKPAVAVGKSVTPDYLVCLEDGKRMKMLKRYLKANFGMTPDDYRRKWGLPADYPMVAPNYARQRSEVARRSGLGRRRR
jgi:predicted transcriptional regulator